VAKGLRRFQFVSNKNETAMTLPAALGNVLPGLLLLVPFWIALVQSTAIALLAFNRTCPEDQVLRPPILIINADQS
jgi:hypothetical protein